MNILINLSIYLNLINYLHNYKKEKIMALSHKLKNNKYIKLMEYLKYIKNFKILLEVRKNARRTRRNRLKYKLSR